MADVCICKLFHIKVHNFVDLTGNDSHEKALGTSLATTNPVLIPFPWVSPREFYPGMR